MIPKHNEQSDFKNQRLTLEDNYENPRIITIRINDATGKVVERKESEIRDNPHRAFLKIIGAFTYYWRKTGGKINELSEEDKRTFQGSVREETQRVQAHLDSGANNNAMRIFMNYAKSKGLI